MSTLSRHRAWLMVGAGIGLLCGLDGALILLGVWSPVLSSRLALWHGPFMTLGFIGTVICLERAVALNHRAGYLVPLSSGLGAVLLASPAPVPFGLSFLAAAQIGLLALYLPLWRRSRDDATVIQAAGALCACGAALLLLSGATVASTIGWLSSYLVLTILGERLELSRLTMMRNRFLPGCAMALLAALLVQVASPALGWPLFGAVLVVMSVWLVRNDVARAGIRRGGQAAFIGGMLMIGYLWLTVAGIIWLVAGPLESGPGYDAAVHAVFLGFVMGMILGHAPIILPSVLRVRLDWSGWFWLPAVLLEVSLVLRLGVGDGLDRPLAVQLGGSLNVIALLSLIAVVVTHVRSRRSHA
ncbi:Uncharacterised protein [Acidipropionibacterium jensenii]|uniref:Uncharacterized protein n=2 Tax=Acidipropionibacterium jensenii TaxID=1749 RepID=A0A3S4W8X0_9ACTN|nr:Uncharacterised protein [Acidipropionibacterium jensenii]